MLLYSSFPFVRITLAFGSGILVAYYWEGPGKVVESLLGFLLLSYVLWVVLLPKTSQHCWSPWLGLLGLGCMFWAGYLHLLLTKVCQTPNHLIHCATTIEAYEAIALDNEHEKEKHSSIIVAVRKARIQGKWQQIHGKIQVFFPKSQASPVDYGDVLLIQGQPQAVLSPKNPYEFDYQSFLGFSQIYHQHFVIKEEVVVMANKPPSAMQALSCRVRNYCKIILTRYIESSEVRAIVLALVLGLQDALDPMLRDAYAGVGTMHVLAVSGLHVGILYGLLRVLLSLLSNIRYARWFSPAISLAALWLYAFVTGLSPSVLRATTMFTLVVIAKIIGRKSSMYNTLASSAFLLLLQDPLLLFSVGFQLSYLAVLGIVYLQPRIYHWLSLKNFWLDKLWLLSSVSLAAQMATIPLSIYYFHQFPTYFLIANWVVVPAASLILCLGVGVLMTSFWAGLSACMAWLLEQVVGTMDQFIFTVWRLPLSVIYPIYWDMPAVLLVYGLLILLLSFFHSKRLPYLVLGNALSIVFSVRAIQAQFLQESQKKIIFYSINHHSVVALVRGHQSILCVDARFKTKNKKYAYHVQPSQVAMGIRTPIHYTLEEATQQHFPWKAEKGLEIAVWQGKKIIFLNKQFRPLSRLIKKIPIDFLVIEENAVATLQPLLAWFDFDTLVIGASNTRALTQQLQEEAEQRCLKSHSLLQQGALTISW